MVRNCEVMSGNVMNKESPAVKIMHRYVTERYIRLFYLKVLASVIVQNEASER
jgi:hypothetical protein